MGSKRYRRLSPILTLGVTAFAVFGIGISLRVMAELSVASPVVADPVAVAQAEELPTVPATSLPDDSIEPTKLAGAPHTGREPLLNDAIQSHLGTVAEVQRVGGLEMTVSNFYPSGGHLFVSVCFEGRGTEGWQVGPVTLTYANGESSSGIDHTTLDLRGSSDSKPGRHCSTLEILDIPAEADLSKLKLSVESVLLAYPEEFKECEAYATRWEKSERMKQLGIVAACSLEPGYTDFTLLAKPEGMTEEDALAIAGQEAGGMIIGPWVFTEANIVVDE